MNSLTCLNNFSKTDSKKNEDINNRDTKYYIENIRHQFPDKLPVNFKCRSSHRWCSLNKIFLKSLQYSKESICVGVFFNKFAGLQP